MDCETKMLLRVIARAQAVIAIRVINKAGLPLSNPAVKGFTDAVLVLDELEAEQRAARRGEAKP